MSCFAAILLTSSCTTDSPIETQNQNLTIPSKPPVPSADVFADGIDDKGLTH